jgi:hypothetical protein
MARIDSDEGICFRGWSLCALADGGKTWRHAAKVRLSFALNPFLEERGGAAVVEMVIDHYNPPDFPCPPGGCPQHPRDDY